VRWPPRSSGAARRPAPGHHGGTPRGVAVRTWLTCPGQGQGLPGPAHGVAGPARGLRPRRVRLPLAKAGLTGWPSACPARVGTRDWPECGAPSSAGTSPGQRVADPVTSASACLGARVGGEPCAVSDWPSVTPCRLIPAHPNRDREGPHGLPPPTPPDVRVTYPAVRRIQWVVSPHSGWAGPARRRSAGVAPSPARGANSDARGRGLT
jgi:hypothetical protein